MIRNALWHKMGFLNLSVQLQYSTGREKKNREKSRDRRRDIHSRTYSIQEKPGLATTSKKKCFNNAPVSTSKPLERRKGNPSGDRLVSVCNHPANTNSLQTLVFFRRFLPADPFERPAKFMAGVVPLGRAVGKSLGGAGREVCARVKMIETRSVRTRNYESRCQTM